MTQWGGKPPLFPQKRGDKTGLEWHKTTPGVQHCEKGVGGGFIPQWGCFYTHDQGCMGMWAIGGSCKRMNCRLDSGCLTGLGVGLRADGSIKQEAIGCNGNFSPKKRRE